jgi:hypothetical protein
MVQVYLSCLYLNNFFLIDKIHLIKIISLNQHRSWGIRRDLIEHSTMFTNQQTSILKLG